MFLEQQLGTISYKIVMFSNSCKPMIINDPISMLGSKKLTIEQKSNKVF